MISGAGILNFMLSLLIVGFICIFCDRLGLLLIAAWCIALLIFVVFRDLSRLLFEWWGRLVFFFFGRFVCRLLVIRHGMLAQLFFVFLVAWLMDRDILIWFSISLCRSLLDLIRSLTSL